MGGDGLQPGSSGGRGGHGRGQGQGQGHGQGRVRTTARSVDDSVMDDDDGSTVSSAGRKRRRQSTPAVVPTLHPTDRKRFVFDGSGWLEYELDGLPSEYRRPGDFEQIGVKFRTDRPNGLLWYIGPSASSDEHQQSTHLSVKVSRLLHLSCS